MVKAQFDSKVKTICIDNSSEFAICQLYSSKDIQHQLSYVTIPHQNSIVGRKHQHLLNIVHALLFQSNAPLTFELIGSHSIIFDRQKSKSHFIQ